MPIAMLPEGDFNTDRLSLVVPANDAEAYRLLKSFGTPVQAGDPASGETGTFPSATELTELSERPTDGET